MPTEFHPGLAKPTLFQRQIRLDFEKLASVDIFDKGACHTLGRLCGTITSVSVNDPGISVSLGGFLNLKEGKTELAYSAYVGSFLTLNHDIYLAMNFCSSAHHAYFLTSDLMTLGPVINIWDKSSTINIKSVRGR